MGNDWHVNKDGKFVAGLSKTGWDRLLNTLGETADAAEIKEMAAERLQNLKDKELPMLKGRGFIVIDPQNPRFDGEEFERIEDAKAHGSNIAYRNGVAIIYAPVAVQRPQRDVVEAQPSELLRQLGLPNAERVATVIPPKSGS